MWRVSDCHLGTVWCKVPVNCIFWGNLLSFCIIFFLWEDIHQSDRSQRESLCKLPISPLNRDMAFSSTTNTVKNHSYNSMTCCVFSSLRVKEWASSLQKLWISSKLPVDLLQPAHKVIAIHFCSQREEMGVNQKHVGKVNFPRVFPTFIRTIC